MISRRHGFSGPFLSGALALLVALAPGAAAANPREIVIAHERLALAGQHLDANVTAFVRRLEEVAKLPKGSLRGRGIPRAHDALDYIKKNRVDFAILPAHQFAVGRRALRLDVLGRAVGIDGQILQFTSVTRKPRPFVDLEAAPGLRVAGTDLQDPAWLAILTEGDLDPRRRPVTLVEVESSKAAVEAVVAKKADLAIVDPITWTEIKPRTDAGDLDWVVTSPKIPPSVFVAVGSFATAAGRKKMAAAVDKICKAEGADICGRLGILYVEPGGADTYADLIAGYEARAGRN